ncbi:leucine-rich repeat, immunoglobulin-like domain and transmembrane domain-containing protein 1 [Brachyhypopomus gauderio]|uniref:leucine-rich repeat, immunoglobulin-like domain and transmembrane domain-containing protein 1 n=1 Tax=Brachyhypopomus gauderio TaxID=698409 RepID=UPI00404364AB
MILHVLLGFCLAFCCLPLLCSACPVHCSCFYHRLSDGSKARSVLCSDPDLTLIPTNFPLDTFKLRIEKTAITSISSEAFAYLSSLEFLWMSFNALSVLYVNSFHGLHTLDELRLDGNILPSFPWECLMDMPGLRLLDLHNNKITSIPADAAIYVKNLTYLDLSSNGLATVPLEVLTVWFSPKLSLDTENSKMILGLHDNPWQCDCRLFDLVQFRKSPSSSVTFIDLRLRCSEPDSLSGILLSEVELRRCQAPRVHMAVARVRSSVGNDVLLRCGTVGVPTPELSWTRFDGKPINGTVLQDISKEGIIWSILSIPAVSDHDSGKYVCKATNIVGSADATVSLIISDTWELDETRVKKIHVKKAAGSGQAAYQEKLISQYVLSTPASAAVPIIESLNGPRSIVSFNSEGYSNFTGISGGKPTVTSPSSVGTDSNLMAKEALSNLAGDASSLQQGPDHRVVRSIKVIGDTDHTVSLNWRAPAATNTTSFSVLYAVFGERDMRRINVGPGKNRVTISGLVPKTKYIACVCVKGLIPKKEQCVIFSTDEAASASGTQKLINVVVITVACVIAVPLTLIVCCGALKRRLQKLLGRKSKDIQETYVTFETLSPGTKAKGLEAEYLGRLMQDESNRLLSARSSVDSEPMARTEGQLTEFFC